MVAYIHETLWLEMAVLKQRAVPGCSVCEVSFLWDIADLTVVMSDLGDLHA